MAMNMNKGPTKQIHDSYFVDGVWLNPDFYQAKYFSTNPLFQKYMRYMEKYNLRY